MTDLFAADPDASPVRVFWNNQGVQTTVLFDLDDTLVDQKSAANAAVLDWAAEHGIDDEDVAHRWGAISAVHYARYQRRELTFAQQRRARAREFLSLDVSDADADAIFAGYLERYEAGWTLFDDAIPALRRARSAGLTVAVFTNGNEDHQRQKLQMFGLEDEVDAVIASSSLPVGKPDPRAFHAALERVGAKAEGIPDDWQQPRQGRPWRSTGGTSSNPGRPSRRTPRAGCANGDEPR